MPKNLTIVFSTAEFHSSCRRLSNQILLYSFLRFINNIISSACNISVLQVCLLAGWRKFLQAACTNQKWLAKPALEHWLSLHLFAILFALCFSSIKIFIPNLKSETSPLHKFIPNSFASCARLSTKDLALPFLQLCNTTTISTLRLYMPKNLTIVFSTAGLHPSC